MVQFKLMKTSKRLTQVPASPMRKLVPFAMEAKKKGVKIYHLNIGDPDIKTPQVMLNVLKTWDKNPISYSNSQGDPEFIKSLLWYYHKLGFKFLKEENIQVTTGGSEAISMAFFAICEPNDEIIVFEPFYANYNSYAVINEVKLKPILTRIENGFHLPSQKIIEKNITAKTKAIFICNPNNPTGTVYTRQEMEMLVKIAKKHKLFLLSDEVYREFAYDNKKQVSLLEFMEEIPDLAIVLDSLSKRYSLCGARLGMLISKNPEIMSGVLRIAQSRLSSGLIDQILATKLTEVKQSYFDKVKREYELRRDVLYVGLKKITGVKVFKPEGAFYTIVGLPVSNAEDFCKWLLTDFRFPSAGSGQAETIMIAPAQGFYGTKNMGQNEVRIAYVLNIKDLKKSLRILKTALEKYQD